MHIVESIDGGMIAARSALLLAILVFPAVAAGAGFDCTKAASAIERSICADPRVDPGFAFLAAYAGQTAGEAQELLAKVRASGRFPGANVRQMQVVLAYP